MRGAWLVCGLYGMWRSMVVTWPDQTIAWPNVQFTFPLWRSGTAVFLASGSTDV